jgi:hypothetical protein
MSNSQSKLMVIGFQLHKNKPLQERPGKDYTNHKYNKSSRQDNYIKPAATSQYVIRSNKMDLSVNFEPKVELKEADQIAGKVTINIGAVIENCFYQVLNDETDDKQWQLYKAITTIYTMGFLSGARAIRERKRAKK